MTARKFKQESGDDEKSKKIDLYETVRSRLQSIGEPYVRKVQVRTVSVLFTVQYAISSYQQKHFYFHENERHTKLFS